MPKIAVCITPLAHLQVEPQALAYTVAGVMPDAHIHATVAPACNAKVLQEPLG